MSTNGIDFVIGGEDNAAPAMSSVEKSLSKLEHATQSLAKGTKDLQDPYEDMISQWVLAEQMAKSAIQPMERLEIKTHQLEKATSSMSGATNTSASALSRMNGAYAAIVAAVAAAAAAIFAAVKTTQAASAAYDAQTEAVRKLDSALRLRGASAASSQMQDMATQMQKLTGVNDNVTLGLMQQAGSMGFSADKMDDAAKAAIGLSFAMGKDASSSMNDMKAALEGNFDAFTQVNPQIMFMRTNQEKLAAVMAIAGQGLSDQAGDMNTVAGSSRRANSAFGSLMESIGAILAPIRVLISAGWEQMATSLEQIFVPAVEYATQILANIGPMIDWVKEKVVQGLNLMIGAFTFFEVILTNLDSVWAIVVAQAELYMLQIAGAVMHALTVVIPAYAAWWAENFVNIFRDALMLVFTVVVNHVTKIIDALTALWDFIASGGTSDILGQLGEISGRSYLEGFESSLTALPEIMGRTITDREKELQATIGTIGGDLGDEFARKMKERMLSVGDSLGGEFDSLNKIDLKNRPNQVMQGINAQESRLLTRGPGSMTLQQTMQQMIGRMDLLINKTQNNGTADRNDNKETIDTIKKNKQDRINLVPVP